MSAVTGQGILIVYCFIAVLVIPVDTAFVVAFLITLVCLSAVNVAGDYKAKCAVIAGYVIAACFAPELLIFGPAVLYSILEYRQYPAGAVLVILCLYFYAGSSPGLLFLLLFGGVLAAALQYGAKRYEKLEELFRKTRDDGRELNLLLKEKNKNILEKQDYEIYTATLRERNRIAREIHDNVGHMLSRAILMVGAMKAVNTEQVMEEPFAQLEHTLNTAMNNVRESVHDLHDDSVNLREALTELTAEFTFCEASLIYDMSYTVPREVKYSFISIVKEALNNVIKHSDASLVKIVAREHPGFYQLVIEDNGKKNARYENTGMQAEEDIEERGSGAGIGIRNMKRRVHMLDGILKISTGNGFRIHITVPKKEETA